MFRYIIYYTHSGEYDSTELILDHEVKNEDDIITLRYSIAEALGVSYYHIYIQYWHLIKRIKKIKVND